MRAESVAEKRAVTTDGTERHAELMQRYSGSDPTGTTLDRAFMERSKLVFNHLAKTGGSSLYFFFLKLLGEQACFRYKKRNAADEAPSIKDLSDQDKARYRFFQQHLPYGDHVFFDAPCLYLGVVRDPIDRLISNYHYNLEKAVEPIKAATKRMTLTDFIETRLEGKANFGSSSTNFLTGVRNSKRAAEVVEKEYLMICTTEQLNDFQAVLARLFGRPDLKALHRNKTGSSDKDDDVRQATNEKFGDYFKVDLQFVAFVRKRFAEHYSKLTLG